MAKHLISFGHGYSKAGAYDSGCTHGSYNEQSMVRKLKPYLQKWATAAGLQVEFYDQNMYADRSVGNYKGYIVTEIHLDAPSGAGGHVIISSQYDPDDTDKRLAAFIAKHFGTVGYVGADGINQRSDLYNLNVCANAGINYRLIELFFLSNDVDRNHYLNDMDAIAKDFIEALSGAEIAASTVAAPIKAVTFSGQAHIQQKGWAEMAGNILGTIGEGLRLEAFSLVVKNNGVVQPINGSIHVQDIGDVEYNSGTNIFGTVGQEKRLEAILINVGNGVQYRVHIENIGWSEWVTSGQLAGTKGQGLRIEAIEFRVA